MSAADALEHGVDGRREAVGVERRLDLAEGRGAQGGPAAAALAEVVPRGVIAQVVARARAMCAGGEAQQPVGVTS